MSIHQPSNYCSISNVFTHQSCTYWSFALPVVFTLTFYSTTPPSVVTGILLVGSPFVDLSSDFAFCCCFPPLFSSCAVYLFCLFSDSPLCSSISVAFNREHFSEFFFVYFADKVDRFKAKLPAFIFQCLFFKILKWAFLVELWRKCLFICCCSIMWLQYAWKIGH